MEEGAERPQRYCRNCGAGVRAGTRFCVSCGTSLIPGQLGSGYSNPGPRSSGSASSFADSLLGTLRGVRLRERTSKMQQWLSYYRPDLNAESVRGMPSRAMGRFRWLHPVIKVLLAGLLLLVLVIVLSPVMRVAAIISFLVSVAFLIWHGVRRRFSPRWSVAAASSLVLIFVFGGISGAIYGGGFVGDGDPLPTGNTAAEEYTDEFGSWVEEHNAYLEEIDDSYRVSSASYTEGTLRIYVSIDVPSDLSQDDQALYYGTAAQGTVTSVDIARIFAENQDIPLNRIVTIDPELDNVIHDQSVAGG